MGPQGVVIEHPVAYELSHTGQRAEDVCIHHLVAKKSIKSFDISILGWFFCLNSVQDNSLRFALFGEAGADKFRFIVGAQLRRWVVAFD